jgi:predicted ATPase
MLKKLRLERFKNFKEAELTLGPLTTLVGANASGKSNIRDAFRFLHGISRGYSLAEIMGEKYVDGGVLQWRGIRGGTREVAFQGSETFALEVSFSIEDEDTEMKYRIEVNPGIDAPFPSIVSERLEHDYDPEHPVFEAEPFDQDIRIKFSSGKYYDYPLANYLPALPRVAGQTLEISSRNFDVAPFTQHFVKHSLNALSNMRFLDLNPEVMRLPSFPGQTILGDRGENLSSVLHSICQDPHSKKALLQWVQELTPMDAVDFEFPSDFTGKILLTLVEKNGQKISAYSASDGTLRFLAAIAALLGPESAQFYFFEELENGIHPTRLQLLLELIERKVNSSNIQMIATTHSPQLLRLLSPQSREYASLLYRLPERSDAQIKRIMDIPEIQRILTEGDLASLHESGWLEDAVYFMEDEASAA